MAQLLEFNHYRFLPQIARFLHIDSLSLKGVFLPKNLFVVQGR